MKGNIVKWKSKRGVKESVNKRSKEKMNGKIKMCDGRLEKLNKEEENNG